MLDPITIRYSFRPVRRSLATGQIADLFGLADTEPPHVIADNVALNIQPGNLVLFTGPSGSGKSSLLRAAGEQLGAVDAMALELPDLPLIDALPGKVEDRLDILAACGLSEARLLLRTPRELSDGQRYRFRLAFALSTFKNPSRTPRNGEGQDTSALLPSPLRGGAGGGVLRFLMADEFAAYLDRALAKVLAFNLRKLVTRTGTGILLATTHEDLSDDLQPDLWVRCQDEGQIDCVRSVDPLKKKQISFADDFWISEGSRSDWPHFARWHYRSHHLAFVRRIVLLWHGREAIGICVFTTPAAALKLRSRYFSLKGARSRLALTALNQQLWLLSRVVLHPTYRGAGIGAAFVRRACETCSVNWIETLTAMGQANPFFERAGFRRVGMIRKSTKTSSAYGGMYGKRGSRVTAETAAKSRHSEPVYYVLDNRGSRGNL